MHLFFGALKENMTSFASKGLGSLAFAMILAGTSYSILGIVGATLIGLISFALMLILTMFDRLSGIKPSRFAHVPHITPAQRENAISQLQYE